MILIIFVVFVALAFIAMWVLSGSFGRIADKASNFTNLFGIGSGEGIINLPAFELPWKTSVPQGPSVEDQVEEWNASRPIGEQVADVSEELQEIERAYQELSAPPPVSSD